MKFLHEVSGMCLDLGPRGMRVEVEEGSKPVVEGVIRALRFCVMLSSIAPRDIRRKSRRHVNQNGYNRSWSLYLSKRLY